MGVLVISSDTNSRADHNSNAATGNATAEERERLVRKLESIGTLGEDDRAALRQLPLHVQAIPDNKDIVRDGDRPSKCCLVLDGFVCRFKLLPDRRQVFLDSSAHW